MNFQQAQYTVAKTLVETLHAEERRITNEYIAANKIVNADGSGPKDIYDIADEEVFETVNYASATVIEETGLLDEILAAREQLKIAEEALIAYGLSLIPEKDRAILQAGCKKNITTRNKVIDLAYHLDTSTVA